MESQSLGKIIWIHKGQKTFEKPKQSVNYLRVPKRLKLLHTFFMVSGDTSIADLGTILLQDHDKVKTVCDIPQQRMIAKGKKFIYLLQGKKV